MYTFAQPHYIDRPQPITRNSSRVALFTVQPLRWLDEGDGFQDEITIRHDGSVNDVMVGLPGTANRCVDGNMQVRVNRGNQPVARHGKREIAAR